jgi:hypothetical protein
VRFRREEVVRLFAVEEAEVGVGEVARGDRFAVEAVLDAQDERVEALRVLVQDEVTADIDGRSRTLTTEHDYHRSHNIHTRQ